MATTFVSPGVYTSEQDFSAYASSIGITSLAMVGLTAKGPAFQPTKIASTDQYAATFGATDVSFPMSYVANNYLSQSSLLTITRVLGAEGFTNSNAWIIQATGGQFAGATLAVIRSKSPDQGNSFYASSASDLQIGNITTVLGAFTLSGTTGPITAHTNSSITVSLDETQSNYIVNVLGQNPMVTTNNDYGFYVESIYPHFIREAAKRGDITGLATALTITNNVAYTNYQDAYAPAVTPWIVSKTVGGVSNKLFYFTTTADGNTANQDIKISIANIDYINNTFDLMIRDFNDTDANVVSLEYYPALTLDPTQSNFIGIAIGTADEEYPQKSNYVTLTLSDNMPTNTVPAGFLGYTLRNTGISGSTNAGYYYKTSYLSGDSTFKTYLGISELAYTANTSSQVSIKNAVSTLEADFFNFIGAETTGTTTSLGFHLENTANPSLFVLGQFNSISGYTKSQAKFTFAPAGGFDGFNQYREPSFTSASIDASDLSQLQLAIDTMANPAEVDFNLFAMPGLDFSTNEVAVKYALDMVETRADSLYVVDAPRVTSNGVKGTAVEVVDLLQETGIDSNYSATYWPWLQIVDQSTNKYLYISPTSEVVRAIALTDNVAYPWFAPAGITRGTVTSAVKRADVKLSQRDKDTLYAGRVNPIATSIQSGIVIWGQKTLQINQTALDRINVRRLLLQVRKLIAAASQTLLFDPNDTTLISQFLAKVNPILLQIQNQRGLAAFKIVMDSSNNTPATLAQNVLNGKIQLQATPDLEFLNLTFQVFPLGANFQ